MSSICKKCVKVQRSFTGRAVILGCPKNGNRDKCKFLSPDQHEYRSSYVPPEYRNLKMLNVSSDTPIDYAKIMYMYGDPGRRGNKVYGIEVQMPA